MRSRGIATLVLTLGLLGATVAAFAGALSATAFSEPVLTDTAPSLLDAGQVRDPLRLRTADALVATVSAVAAMDPQTRDRLAESVLDQPSFVAGFAGVVSSVYDHIFNGETGLIVVDPAAVRSATDAALAEVTPDLSAVVPPESLPLVAVDTATIPRLDGWDRATRVGAIVLAVVSIVAIGFGIARGDKRLRAVGRVGRWCVVVGLCVLAVFWLIPTLVTPLLGGWIEVGGIALSGSSALLVPGLAAVAVGMSFMYLASRFTKLQREHALSSVPRAPSRRVTDVDRRTA